MSDDGTPGELDYELDDFLDASTPDRHKAIADPLRSEVIDLVLERAMTVSELAGRLDRPRGTVAYHVDVLVAAGLLKVVRTRKVRAIEERYYVRTARTFGIHHGPDELPFFAEAAAQIDLARMSETVGSGATLRHARIPAERAQDYLDRLFALSLEFTAEPRAGDTEYALLITMFPTTRRFRPREADPDEP